MARSHADAEHDLSSGLTRPMPSRSYSDSPGVGQAPSRARLLASASWRTPASRSRKPSTSPTCSCSRPDELNTMIPAFWPELPEIVRRDQRPRPRPGRSCSLRPASTSAPAWTSPCSPAGAGRRGGAGAGRPHRDRAAVRANLRPTSCTSRSRSPRSSRPACRCSPRSRAGASAARSTWSARPTCGTRPPMRSSASRRSTSA